MLARRLGDAGGLGAAPQRRSSVGYASPHSVQGSARGYATFSACRGAESAALNEPMKEEREAAAAKEAEEKGDGVGGAEDDGAEGATPHAGNGRLYRDPVTGALHRHHA